MPGEWDESKHPRGADGKFGAGGGGGEEAGGKSASAKKTARDERRERQLAERTHKDRYAASDPVFQKHGIDPWSGRMAMSSGRLPKEIADEVRQSEAAADRTAHHESEFAALTAKQDAAIAAGHVSADTFAPLIDRYRKNADSLNAKSIAIGKDLADKTAAAVAAIKSIEAFDDQLSELESDEVDSMSSGDFTKLNRDESGKAVTGSDDDVDDEDRDVAFSLPPKAKELIERFPDGDPGDPKDEMDDPPEPPSKEFHTNEDGELDTEAYAADLADFKKEKAEYDAALATRKKDAADYKSLVAAAEKERAALCVEAQTALEAMHKRQAEAIAELKALGDQADDVASSYDEVVEYEPADAVNDSTPEDAYDDAVSAADALRQEAEIELESIRVVDVVGAIETLKDEAKSVARRIKQLSKITGRAAKIAKPPAKAKKPTKAKKVADDDDDDDDDDEEE